MKLTSATALIFLLILAPVPTRALDRPAWMDQPGIVMAGSWEAPAFARAAQAGWISPCRPTSSPVTSASTARKWSLG